MEQEEISLVELFNILKKNILLIIITTILTTIIAGVYTFFIVTPMYQSTTEILVTQMADERATVSQADINTSLSLINTYEDIIRNDVILDPVIDELDLDTTSGALRENVTIRVNDQSQVFSLQVEDENPYQAAEIANATASIFQEEIYGIMNVDNVTIISQAEPNVNPASPNNLVNVIIGFMLGAMIGIGLVFLKELTDNTVKSLEYVEKATGWSNLGQVNQFSKNDLLVKTPLPKKQQPTSKSDEKLKRTRRRV